MFTLCKSNFHCRYLFHFSFHLFAGSFHPLLLRQRFWKHRQSRWTWSRLWPPRPWKQQWRSRRAAGRSLILSDTGRALSLSAIWVCKSASSSFISTMLPSVVSLSEGEVFSSWSYSFRRHSSLSRSFKSSNGFVLFSLSSMAFISRSFVVSLLTNTCNFHRFFTSF